MGFEPTRGDPIGLAVQRLNHSATSSYNASGQTQFKFINFIELIFLLTSHDNYITWM